MDQLQEYSFNQEFRTKLEYHLSQTFKNSDDPELRGLWCDGVNEPEIVAQLDRKIVNDNRQIVTTAWIGLEGQETYQLTIKFGNKALSRYARGLSLALCLPSSAPTDWLTMDIEQQTIELKLL
ncbi:hypothetical protein [Marinoscillum pacificum]|uniref:hypothetical protein n=1 Tax=Marinoscillum pacificum TaxID=392723 RepID=UPI002158791F|nr:hypothetical protein [Marinoscillum pacificum]